MVDCTFSLDGKKQEMYAEFCGKWPLGIPIEPAKDQAYNQAFVLVLLTLWVVPRLLFKPHCLIRHLQHYNITGRTVQ
jgi:hypothetical protein